MTVLSILTVLLSLQITTGWKVGHSRQFVNRATQYRSGLSMSSVINGAAAMTPIDRPLMDKNPDGVVLNIFVVDCSSPGSNNRIQAVQGAVMGILRNRNERGHACVITCYQNDAEITLEPTSSITKAMRCLGNMKKSVMGNLGRGIEIALQQIDDSINDGYAKEAVLTIISHGKAHGLLSTTSICETEDVDLCDTELFDSASTLASRGEELSKKGFSLKTLLIDADPNKLQDITWGDEGVRIAAVCNAKYFHSRDLTDEEIL
eukprot:gene13022-27475_t